MASSTEHTDELLEWRPGPPEAATTNVLRALAWGARRAWASKLLIAYLWVFYLLLVDRGAVVLLEALRTASSWAEAAQSVIGAATVGSVFSPQAVQAAYRALLLESMARPVWDPSSYFVLFYGVLAGGIIAHLHAPRPAPLLAQLGAGCGTYMGRFLRLLLIAAAALWALLWVGTIFFAGAAAGDGLWTRLILLQAMVTVLAVILDYARVRTVARDSRSMLLETARSARFFARNLPRTLGLEVLLLALTAVTGALVLTLAGGLRWVLDEQTTVFVAEQTYVVAMLWVRLTGWGAMLALYQGIATRRLAQRDA